MHTYFRSDRTRGLSGPTIICICAYTQCERILIPTAKFFPLFVSHPRLALSFLPFVTPFSSRAFSFFLFSLFLPSFFFSSLLFVRKGSSFFLTWSSSYRYCSPFCSSSFVFVSTHPLFSFLQRGKNAKRYRLRRLFRSAGDKSG